jgi:hypothetical protein
MSELNIDKLHAEWMDNYKKLAIEVLGPNDVRVRVIHCCDGTVEDPVTGGEYDYSHDGDILLPRDWAKVTFVMAKFSQAWLSNPPTIKGLETLKEYPIDTYNLRSLLTAAYPRHIDTEIFKGDNVGILVLSLADYAEEATEGGAFFVALGGLGVILMEELRKLLGETLTDEEVMELCTNRYLLEAGDKE